MPDIWMSIKFLLKSSLSQSLICPLVFTQDICFWIFILFDICHPLPSGEAEEVWSSGEKAQTWKRKWDCHDYDCYQLSIGSQQ